MKQTILSCILALCLAMPAWTETPVSVEALMDSDPAVRHTAAEQLRTAAIRLISDEEQKELRKYLRKALEELDAMGGWQNETEQPENWLAAIWAWRDAAEAAEAREASRIARQDGQVALLQTFGYVGTEEDVDLLLQWGRRMHTRDAAMTALGMLPIDECTTVLIEQLESLPQTTQILAVQILGQGKAEVVGDALVALAQSTPAKAVTWACLEAMAQLGIPPSAAYPPQQGYTTKEAARYGNLGLQAAQVMMELDPEQATEILVNYTKLYTQRHQLRAALLGLQALGAEDATNLALGYLGTPALRSTAMEILEQSTQAGLDEKMVALLKHDNPVQDASLLKILQARQYGDMSTLIENAASSESPILRFRAARLQDTLPTMEDMASVVRVNTPWLRLEALSLLQADHEDVAGLRRTMLKEALPQAVKTALLTALAEHGTPEDLLVIDQLLTDPALVKEAYEAAGAIMKRYPDAHETHLLRNEMSMVLQRPDTARLHIQPEALSPADQKALLAEYGYIQQWEILGALVTGQLDGNLSGAQALALSEKNSIPVDEVPYPWKTSETAGVPALLDFTAAYGPFEEAHAFARTTVSVPDWTAVVLVVDHDDKVELWLNGKALDPAPVQGSFTEAAHRVRCSLQPGINRILLRSSQTKDDWRVGLQIQQRDGDPLNLLEQSMPDLGTKKVGLGKEKINLLLESDIP